MEVTKLDEKDDGSAIVELDLSAEEARILIEYALQHLLAKAMDEYDRKES